MNLWDVEAAAGKLTKVDTDYLIDLNRDFAWSGDSRWIAFARYLPNRHRAIFVYSLDDGQSRQITDGMSDATDPAFDRDGQYLYFTASTNYGPTSSTLDMTSDEHEVTRSVYLAVLPNNIPSPLAPESDEEKAPGEAAASAENSQNPPDSAAGTGGGGRGGRGAAAADHAAQAGPHRFRQTTAAHRRAAASRAGLSIAHGGKGWHGLPCRG